MTYRELMEEVIHLGFDSAVEDLGALCSATNRAVAQLRRELCPATGRFQVMVRKPVGYSADETPVEDGGACEICFPTGVAITFECVGHALIRFEADGEEFRSEQIDAPSWRVYKYAFPHNRGAKVVLMNTDGFSLRNVAVFGAVDSLVVNALPVVCDRHATYDVSAFCEDFIGIDETPFNAMGLPIRGYEIYGKNLTLPIEAGRVEVTYRRRLREATLEDFSEGMLSEPDVPEEYADMLPLSVASYVWADVEPEKAAHYRQMYNEQLQYEKLQQKHRGRCRVIDRKRWR